MKVSEVKELITQSAEDALQEYGIDHNDNYGTFLYGTTEEQNMQYSKQMPHIYLEPIKRTWNSEDGKAEFPIMMYFYDQDKADSNGEQVALIQSRMENLQDKFINELLLMEMFNNASFISEPFEKAMQGIFSGWRLQFTLTAKHVIC